MNKCKEDNKSSPAKKYNVEYSKKLGRYLTAGKDISAGELIFREDALAVGPAIITTGILCFACMRQLPGYRDSKSTYSYCTKCNVAPLCNRVCEKSVGQHSSRECNLFREKNNLYLENLDELVRILLHLRLWLLKDEEEKEVWQNIERMESHIDKRRNTPVWEEREIEVVEIFRKLELYNPDSKDDETIQRLCGIVDVNAFELRGPNTGEESSTIAITPLRGLFLQASLMAHECRGTAHVAVDADFNMSVHAAVALDAGSIISFNYTSSLLGTIERQEHLQEGKYFRCECKACRDPLEDGSYVSCIACPRCKKDYVALQSTTKEKQHHPYDKKAKWQCQRCKRLFTGCLVKTTVDIARQLVQDVDPFNFKAMNNLLERLSRTFHSNHFVMLSLKQKILTYCRKEIASINPQRKILQRMLELCNEFLIVLNIVEPGISRLKGITMYELHLPMAILASRAYAAREIRAEELQARLEAAEAQLRRALAMLLLEPARTPEGQLARRALQEVRMLTRSVEDARALVQADKLLEAHQVRGGNSRRERRRCGGNGNK